MHGWRRQREAHGRRRQEEALGRRRQREAHGRRRQEEALGRRRQVEELARLRDSLPASRGLWNGGRSLLPPPPPFSRAGRHSSVDHNWGCCEIISRHWRRCGIIGRHWRCSSLLRWETSQEPHKFPKRKVIQPPHPPPVEGLIEDTVEHVLQCHMVEPQPLCSLLSPSSTGSSSWWVRSVRVGGREESEGPIAGKWAFY